MAKQTFTTGSVLTAAQMNSLQANDYNWTVNSQTASYVLVAADAGKRVEMNSGSGTTITVNTGLFTAGDMVYISNIGAGTCTVTAGTATVSKSTNASLALGQYQGGILYFVSASASIFYPFDIGSSTPSLVGCQAVAGTQTLTTATWTAINFGSSENWDTDSFHSLASNTSRFTIPAGKAGKYSLQTRIEFGGAGAGTGNRGIAFYKNGVVVRTMMWVTANTVDVTDLTAIDYFDLVATDYLEVFAYHTRGSDLGLPSGNVATLTYLGA